MQGMHHLFLPPVLAGSLHGQPVEEVLFMRDEMANMVWAVEHIVESSIGTPLNRHLEYQKKRQIEKDSRDADQAAQRLTYRLMNKVPDYWMPFLPVRVDQGSAAIRLREGRMLTDSSGTPTPNLSLGRILEPSKDLNIFEEEVPRAGIQVTRSYQYARWIDGSTHVWIGRQKKTGRGEGTSGLRFDILTQ
jgi:hypothetical protein